MQLLDCNVRLLLQLACVKSADSGQSLLYWNSAGDGDIESID